MSIIGSMWKDQKDKMFKVVHYWQEDTPPHPSINHWKPYTVLVLKDILTGKTYSVAQNVVYKDYKQVN